MVNFPKIIQVADAACDCFPVLSTVTNGLYLLYQTAHKVDVHSPVEPGFITSLKIHTLSKRRTYCWLAAVPLIGNLASLWLLVENICRGFFRNNNLAAAIGAQNLEVVHLRIGNGDLQKEEESSGTLQRAVWSTEEIFNKVLHSRSWSTAVLLGALPRAANEGRRFCAQPLIDLLPEELSFKETSEFFSNSVGPLIQCLLLEDKPLLDTLHSKLLPFTQVLDETQANQFANDILFARDFYLLKACTSKYQWQFSKETKLEILRTLPIGGLSSEERPEYYEAQREFFDTRWKAWSSDFSEEDFQKIKENPKLLSEDPYLRPLCIQKNQWILRLPRSSDAPSTT